MCLLHTDSHLQTDMIMTIDHVSCHYSCHYHHCVWWCAFDTDYISSKVVSQSWECGSSSDTAIILLPIFCLYRQPMPIFCLRVGSAYILGWFPNLPIVTQSCVFSQSRQIHPGHPASHVMLPLSKVTCHVSCENCDSSNFKWFLWHVACVCVTHYHALFWSLECNVCRSVKSRQWNRSVCIRIGCFSFSDKSGHDLQSPSMT